MPDPESLSSRRGFLSRSLGGTGAALLAGALPAAVTSACAGTSGAGAAKGASAAGTSTAGASAADAAADERSDGPVRDERRRERVIASTWKFGRAANDVAWEKLLGGIEHPIDACEVGVRVTEADESNRTVGYGGRPNAEGRVELDSAIMRGDTLECGAVAALQNILHPVTVARAVMEHTPHVLLVGEGALSFARSRGIPEQEMLSPKARELWERWLEDQVPPPIDADNHDTIGMIVYEGGRFGMAVTTSGWGFKLPGRVGDSPIVGAGGYCDDDAGACVATGTGEEMIRHCASYAVVEALRNGAHPDDACKQVVRRIHTRSGDRDPAVSLLAVDVHGRVGSATIRANFNYARTDDRDGTVLLPSERLS